MRSQFGCSRRGFGVGKAGAGRAQQLGKARGCVFSDGKMGGSLMHFFFVKDPLQELAGSEDTVRICSPPP